MEKISISSGNRKLGAIPRGPRVLLVTSQGGGNCTACACAGIGCLELQNGETIAIYQH